MGIDQITLFLTAKLCAQIAMLEKPEKLGGNYPSREFYCNE